MTTEVESVSRLARAGCAQMIKTVDGREFLITPDETAHVEVSDPHGLKLSRPRYISQQVSLQTTDSLVDYCNRFKGTGTIIFADFQTNSITAAIDYHGAAQPENVAHCAKLSLCYSTEWQEWNRISGHLKEQLEFARFIEENGADVRAPTGADLLECVRDLQAHRKVNFMKAVRTSSENENFEWSDETTASSKKGAVEVPTKFQLGIPVYFGEPDVDLFAFLRWRLLDGSLMLGIQLHRAEHVRQAVFKAIVTDIGEHTQCPTVFGKI